MMAQSALHTNENKLSKAVSFVIRLITLPPVMALCAISILHFQLGFFPGTSFPFALFCLSFLPLLPYPICFMIPSLRYRGRFIQRGMAVVFSVIGYVTGTAYCLLNGLHGMELCIFLSYLLSKRLLLFFHPTIRAIQAYYATIVESNDKIL